MNTQNEPQSTIGCNAPTSEELNEQAELIPPPPMADGDFIPPPPPTEHVLPQVPPLINNTMPSAPAGSWNPNPNAQRMSRARYRLRCKEQGKEVWAWHKTHWLTWVLPLALNIVAVLVFLGSLCYTSFPLLILTLVLIIVAEPLLLVYNIRFLLFLLKNKYCNDYKLRLHDLGYPSALAWLPVVPVFFAALLIESALGMLLIFLICILPLLLLFYLPGNPGPNKYGPVPDDEPTPEK
jgi:uncharacterized membrane protein YhaH (DUF805 family)